MQKESIQVLSGWRVKRVFLSLYLQLIVYLLRQLRSLESVRTTFTTIQDRLAVYKLKKSFHKLVRHEGRYYLSCNLPGFPNKAMFDKLLALANAGLGFSSLDNIGMVQIAFTKKCPLNCAHCYEGKILNQPEGISLEEHIQIVQKLQKSNVPVIQFGGGEPLNRFDDLIALLRSSQKRTDFWIYTSGYGLTQQKANELKQHGLTGVSISIDHYEPDAHNLFRRNQKSYDWAIAAVTHAKNAELLVTLSICVTNEFCTSKNLYNYYDFAHKLGVQFVQLLEPRAVGNFEGQNVLLTPESIQIAEAFFVSVSTSKTYRKHPIVQYYGYQQRRAGCVGAAERYIFIDADGYVQSCPFCESRKSHFLYGDIQKDLLALKAEGCQYNLSSNYEKTNA